MSLILMSDGRPCRSASGITAECGLKAFAARLACEKFLGVLDMWWSPSGKLMARSGDGRSRFTGIELLRVPVLPTADLEREIAEVMAMP
ncbi:hypothetical protein [Streptomyces sp. NPDC008121]|uniref:hypothetical protein n=1 Tax=Streptomyces sp. NPDC008121 TaxID=3364809 RepID=UPI0036E7260E